MRNERAQVSSKIAACFGKDYDFTGFNKTAESETYLTVCGHMNLLPEINVISISKKQDKVIVQMHAVKPDEARYIRSFNNTQLHDGRTLIIKK